MCCKSFGLDVRTYCNNDVFERLVSLSPEQVSSFLSKSFKLYTSLIKYFK
jgi:hypothetical protein